MTQQTIDRTGTTTVRHGWVPVVGALAGAALTVKAGLIIASGDEVSDTSMGVLYVGGLLLGAAAAVGVGLRRHRTWARWATAVGLCLLLVQWVVGLSDALKPVFGAFSDAQHVKDEGGILVLGVVLLGLSLVARAKDQARAT